MKILKIVLVLTGFLIGTNSFAQDPHTEGGLTKGIVQEVVQVSSYTYLNLLVDGEKKWVAAPTLDAKLGEVYYYKGGMEMRDFTSTELERTFDSVLFLSSITSANIIDDSGNVKQEEINKMQELNPGTLDKVELSISEVEGGIRIADLFKNKADFAGKKIRVHGEVTKFSSGIMGKNWVHFQDGTEFEGAYDLMITTQENVAVGDDVTFEGVITLDKDFGAGYFYKIIMEEAVKVEY